MTDESRKRLALYMGEKWHKLSVIHTVRSFTTFRDAGELAQKMVEKGDWTSFLSYAASRFNPDTEAQKGEPANLTAWLMIKPARFCELAGEWRKSLETKEVK